MKIEEYVGYLKKIHKGKKVNLVANSRSADVINYSYLGRNWAYAKDSLLMLIKMNKRRRLWLIPRYFQLRRMSEHHLHTVVFSLYSSFVMNYSKCFGRAAGGKISLDAKKVYKDNEKLQELHKNIDDDRNNLIAHDGSYEHEASYCILIEDAQKGTVILETPIMTITVPDNKLLKEYKQLLIILRKYIEEKRERVVNSFLEELGLQNGGKV